MPNLRERTRRAVRNEIMEAAAALVVERGYDALTVEDIAVAAGMSKRSMFRYFATKEDIVLGKLGDELGRKLDRLRARPLGEPVWESLRVMLDSTDDPPGTKVLTGLVLRTPATLGVYLRRMQMMQDDVVAILLERERGGGHGDGPGSERAGMRTSGRADELGPERADMRTSGRADAPGSERAGIRGSGRADGLGLEQAAGQATGGVDERSAGGAAGRDPGAEAALRAVTGAAFGCFVSAQFTWLGDDDDGGAALTPYVNRAFAAVMPVS